MSHTILPSLETLKSQAKSLRAGLAETAQPISHGHALELVARQYGYRDWNTLHAAAGNRPPARLTLGQRVAGRYLGHPFKGELVAVRAMTGGYHEVTVRFDVPIDVVASRHMTSLRSRVNAVIDAAGKTAEKTSDGQPHLVLELPRLTALA